MWYTFLSAAASTPCPSRALARNLTGSNLRNVSAIRTSTDISFHRNVSVQRMACHQRLAASGVHMDQPGHEICCYTSSRPEKDAKFARTGQRTTTTLVLLIRLLPAVLPYAPRMNLRSRLRGAHHELRQSSPSRRDVRLLRIMFSVGPGSWDDSTLHMRLREKRDVRVSRKSSISCFARGEDWGAFSKLSA